MFFFVSRSNGRVHSLKEFQGGDKTERNSPLHKDPQTSEGLNTSLGARMSGIAWITIGSSDWSMVTQTIPEILAVLEWQ